MTAECGSYFWPISKKINRPFVDFECNSFEATHLSFFTAASKNPLLGFRCYFNKRWIFGQWGNNYIKEKDPSKAYLELFALCVGIFTWQRDSRLANCRIIVNCDNQSVVEMVNKMTSSCPNYMYLLRMLALNNITYNRWVFVRYVNMKLNFLSDSLSCMKLNLFFKLVPMGTRGEPDPLPEELWPALKLWQSYC